MHKKIKAPASLLRAMLCIIDPESGPRLAVHEAATAAALCDLLNAALGEKHGAAEVSVEFKTPKIHREFCGVASSLHMQFGRLANIYTYTKEQ